MPGPNVIREGHIERIYQNNDPTSDIWVDIERLDYMWVRVTDPENLGTIEYEWTFAWEEFDPDSMKQAPVALKGPINEHKIISDPDNPDSTISIPLRRYIFVRDGYSGYHWFFDNTTSNTTRKVHKAHIVHRDIPPETLDENGQPPGHAIRTAARDYLPLLQEGEKDETQWIDVEVIDDYKLSQNSKDKYSKKRWAANVNAVLSEQLL